MKGVLGVLLALVIATSACASNPQVKNLPPQAQREYTLDQVVKIVNDSTTGAIAANRGHLLSDDVEKEILTINKGVLDVLSTAPSNWKELALAVIQKRRSVLPANVNAVIDEYLKTTVTALGGGQ